jgi:Na+-transporting NADH:ubiquinone oxidoreductase subunit NqrD
VWAASAGHQDAATVVSGVATVAAALLLLLARDRTVRLPRSFRIIVWLVLVISFVIVLLGLRRTMGFA